MFEKFINISYNPARKKKAQCIVDLSLKFQISNVWFKVLQYVIIWLNCAVLLMQSVCIHLNWFIEKHKTTLDDLLG